MKTISLQDLKIDLNFKQLCYIDHSDKFEYTEQGLRTDKVVGSRVDLFGITEDGQKKFFTVSTEQVLPSDAFKLGEKVKVISPQVSAWFDRNKNVLNVSVKATTINAL